MKIKFSKQVRAALPLFSKSDQRNYVRNAVWNQLVKDGRIEIPINVSRETVEFFSSGGSVLSPSRSTPLESEVRSPASDAEQKESEPVSEAPRPIHPAYGSGYAAGGGGGSVSPPVFYAGGGGAIGSSGSVGTGGGVTSEFGTFFRTDGITLRVPSRSNALESEDRSPQGN